MGTTADKLTYLGQTKSEIRDAIISKGVSVPVETTFREYAALITDITSGGSTPEPNPYIRPSDWLPIDNLVVEGDQKFVGLYAIFEDGNFLSLSASGNYTVDWGDGIVENYGADTQAYHIYDYYNFIGTECSKGYRQSIVTVTPQPGQNLTSINLQKKHNQEGLQAYVNMWLDIKLSGIHMTSLIVSDITWPIANLEIFEYVGSNLITNFSNLLNGCVVLHHVTAIDTTNCTDIKNMFSSCVSLILIPELNTVNVINFSGMFSSCYKLKSIPELNTINGVDFSHMFNSCFALKSIPELNTMNGTNFNAMFSACYALESIPVLNTMNGVDFSQMFANCRVLNTIPLLNTGKGTSFTSMFVNCYALFTIPLLDTSFSINFTSMFNGCKSLQTIPLLQSINITSNFSNMFNGCSSLTKGALYGTKATLSYTGCKLSAPAVVDIFNNLASGVVAKTITITNNWGASLLTAEERAIATSKGWTIVG